MLIVQSPARPGAIRNAIADMLDKNVTRLAIASAYTTVEGSKIVYEAIEAAVGAKLLQAMPKTLITAFDYGLTQPKALAFWLEQPNSQVFVAGAERLKKGSLQPKGSAFHPKLYAFALPNGRANLLVGSANMTGRGLSANCEAATASLDVPESDVADAFDLVRREAVPLDTALLKLYEEQRKKTPPPTVIAGEVEPLPEPALPGRSDLPLLRDAVVAGNIRLQTEQQMWVQSRPKTEGGSLNQVETARGANGFFGFTYTAYPAAHETIGFPLLFSGSREWTDRPIAWHGAPKENKMERINLPTKTQGGFEYQNAAVLFRRHPNNRFELIVAPWESDLAKSWREASRAAGKLYLVGERTKRLTGFI